MVRTLDIGKFISFDLGVFDLSLIESFWSVLVLEAETQSTIICTDTLLGFTYHSEVVYLQFKADIMMVF